MHPSIGVEGSQEEESRIRARSDRLHAERSASAVSVENRKHKLDIDSQELRQHQQVGSVCAIAKHFT